MPKLTSLTFSPVNKSYKIDGIGKGWEVASCDSGACENESEALFGTVKELSTVKGANGSGILIVASRGYVIVAPARYQCIDVYQSAAVSSARLLLLHRIGISRLISRPARDHHTTPLEQHFDHPANLNLVASNLPKPSRGATFRRRKLLVKSCSRLRILRTSPLSTLC